MLLADLAKDDGRESKRKLDLNSLQRCCCGFHVRVSKGAYYAAEVLHVHGATRIHVCVLSKFSPLLMV